MSVRPTESEVKERRRTTTCECAHAIRSTAVEKDTKSRRACFVWSDVERSTVVLPSMRRPDASSFHTIPSRRSPACQPTIRQTNKALFRALRSYASMDLLLVCFGMYYYFIYYNCIQFLFLDHVPNND